MVKSNSFHDPDNRKVKELLPGVKVRTFWEDELMLVVVELDSGAEIPIHQHPHQQAGMVIEGQMKLTIAEEKKIVKKGDIYFIPGGVDHSVKVGPDSTKVLDIFHPVREEYKY